MSAMTVLVCKSRSASAEAQAYLRSRGYKLDRITIEEVEDFNYDAQRYGPPGGQSDISAGFVVIGRM